MIRIDWQRHVMSDYVAQFKQQYQKDQAEKNVVLGFSFGAMIALISAGELRPDKLVLCSLSPYFREDLKKMQATMSKHDASVIGRHRMEDFQQFSALSCARQVVSPTVVFCGGREAKQYPLLLRRCKEAAQVIRNGRLVMASNAPHNIAFPTYVEAIKKEV